jgi:hypothetical protein
LCDLDLTARGTAHATGATLHFLGRLLGAQPTGLAAYNWIVRPDRYSARCRGSQPSTGSSSTCTSATMARRTSRLRALELQVRAQRRRDRRPHGRRRRTVRLLGRHGHVAPEREPGNVRRGVRRETLHARRLAHHAAGAVRWPISRSGRDRTPDSIRRVTSSDRRASRAADARVRAGRRRAARRGICGRWRARPGPPVQPARGVQVPRNVGGTRSPTPRWSRPESSPQDR